MSLFPFAKNFGVAEGQKAVSAGIRALVGFDPEAASIADLRTMEEDLNKAGATIARLRAELAKERREAAEIETKYSQLMSAAEILQKRIAAEPDNQSLPKSLEELVSQIEKIAPELDRDKADAKATESLLDDAQQAYQAKAKALSDGKANLDRARHDLEHANLQAERAKKRAEDQAAVAGLRQPGVSGINIALNAMQEKAALARRSAEAADMKTEALKGAADVEHADPNIASAMAEVSGEPSSKSLTERLAALKRE